MPSGQGRVESVAEIMPAEDAAVADEKAAVADETPLLKLDSNRLRPYEEMLMRYIVRDGLLYITDIADEDGNIRPGTVFDLIDSELSLDGSR